MASGTKSQLSFRLWPLVGQPCSGDDLTLTCIRAAHSGFSGFSTMFWRMATLKSIRAAHTGFSGFLKRHKVGDRLGIRRVGLGGVKVRSGGRI